MPTISKQLALLFITMAWKMCIARIGSGEYDIGSGDASFDQIDTEFHVKLLALRPTQFFIYWPEPDTSSEVSYYQVSYNVTVIYQTTAGQRIFNDSQTSDELYNGKTFGIPLYNTNSTYTVQVVAVTVDKEIITSNNITISPDYLIHYNVVGQPDAIRFFQLGLELTDPGATIDCQSLEGNYTSVLRLAQLQLSQAVQEVCTETHGSNETCVTQFANDYFHCHNNRLVYVARVVSTVHTNTTTFLRYLTLLMGSAEISLHNLSFSVISLPSCPLSIPSAEESNCYLSSLAVDDSNETIIDSTKATSTTTSEPTNDIVTVTIIVLSCLVGIILMTSCVVGVMYVCSICNHYQGDVESLDLEGEEQQKVSPPGQLVEEHEDLPTVSYPGGPPSSWPPQCIVHVPITQTFSTSLNGDALLSSSHSNSCHGSH